MLTIGLDLGKERDYSALAVVHKTGAQLSAVKLHRWPLGTSYVTVAQDVSRLTNKPEIADKAVLVVDATGLGGPFMDTLAACRPGCGVVALTIGGRGKLKPAGTHWKVGVPKKTLVQTFVAAVQSQRFTVAKSEALSPILLDEMGRLQVKISDKGHATYAADFEAGSNDDLLLSAMYAVWMTDKGMVA